MEAEELNFISFLLEVLPVLQWVPLETDPQRKIGVQVVYLGSDPRK